MYHKEINVAEIMREIKKNVNIANDFGFEYMQENQDFDEPHLLLSPNEY